MSPFVRYILAFLGIALAGFLLWYFSSIVAYIAVASVLSLIGSPIVDLLGKVRIKKFALPSWFTSLITLFVLWFLVFGFFSVFIPVIAREAGELSRIDTNLLISRLDEPLAKIEEIWDKLQLNNHEAKSFDVYLQEKISNALNFSIISDLFTSVAKVLGDAFFAMFSISFITFFLLKEQGMLAEALVVLFPKRHEDNIRRALRSVKHLLSRYFIGICLQLTGILILVTLGMSIVGLGFKRSLLIGLVAAILNVIPYLGPLIGSALGVLLGIAFNINLEFIDLAHLAGYMAIVFLSVQMVDNFIFQPFIFSGSVNAHPLEIFIVILMAGSIAGVTGMILAIPAYTIIRVFAREFFSRFRLVKKLTENM